MQQETNKIAYRINEAVKASGLGRTFLYREHETDTQRDPTPNQSRTQAQRSSSDLREDLLEFLRLPEGRAR